MELARQRQIIKRLHQSGSASAEKVQTKEHTVELERELKDHRASASESQTFYRETVTKCLETWKVIESLMAKTALIEEEEELASKKHVFTLVLSADYQQSILIGEALHSPVIYKRCHMMCTVSWDGQQYITLFDERIGPKNTDHTISITQSYIEKVVALHPWI